MESLFQLIDPRYFVQDLRTNSLYSIKIALLRETTGNMIIRSNYADETISFRVGDRDLVEIPARKLKSREKMTGLKICREFGVVAETLRYNAIKKSDDLANANSLLFGDSVTKSGDAIGLRSRVIYDWAYSLRDVQEVTERLQHNALGEGGTMMDEEKGGFRQSLFQTQYIKPGTCFPHFVTAENLTPELFFHLISTLMHTHRYGAQDTTLGTNMRNHILGVGLGRFEAPINSYQIARDWEPELAATPASVREKMEAAMQAAYGDGYISGDKLTAWADDVWRSPDTLQAIYRQTQQEARQFLEATKVITPKKSTRK